MSRALTILKYVPAILCGLLLLVWIATTNFHQFGVVLPWPSLASGMTTVENREPRKDFVAYISGGNLVLLWADSDGWGTPRLFAFAHQRFAGPAKSHLGSLRLWKVEGPYACYSSFPFPVLLSGLSAVGLTAVWRFRFPLWSWFAFTALVAVELAYYLR